MVPRDSGRRALRGGIIASFTDGAPLNDSTRSVIDRRQPRPSGTEEARPIMSRRKALLALAAVMAALALAVPAASASTARTAPAVRTAFIGAGGPLVRPLPPGSLPCRILVRQIQFALLTGHPVWANFLSNVFLYSGCGGAAV
jgi:hypothetical protein